MQLRLTILLAVLLLSTGCDPPARRYRAPGPTASRIPDEDRKDFSKLLEHLRSSDSQERREAQQLMSELPAAESVAELVKLYRSNWDEDAASRLHLVAALRAFNGQARETAEMLADDYSRLDAEQEGESPQLRQSLIDFFAALQPDADLFPLLVRCHAYSNAVGVPQAEQRSWLKLIGQAGLKADVAMEQRERLEPVLIEHLRIVGDDPQAVAELLPLATWLVQTRPANPSAASDLDEVLAGTISALDGRLSALLEEEPPATSTQRIRRRRREITNPAHTTWSRQVEELKAPLEALRKLQEATGAG